ncbi:MAG: carboxypeptidase-like regulatory domain-containing protein, partial [Bacteroidetes bacterium]
MKPGNTIAFLVTFFLILTGQIMDLQGQGYRLSGVVIEKASGQAVPDVTVYLNATSRGTITGPDGRFELAGAELPAELIISHLSYEVVRILLFDPKGLTGLKVELDPRFISLEEVTVIQRNIREEYLNRFRTWFLGTDYSRYGADILND